MKTGYCSTEGCDNQSVRDVPVSIDETQVETRGMCGPCEEAYSKGCQHGHFRAVRNVRAMGFAAVADLLSACLGEPETCPQRASGVTTHIGVWGFADADNDVAVFVGRYDHPPSDDEVKHDAYLWAHDKYEAGCEPVAIPQDEFDRWHDGLCQVGGVQIISVA